MILTTYHLDEAMYDANKIQLSKNWMLKWLLMIKLWMHVQGNNSWPLDKGMLVINLT
jgi:hypothetical protein